jgi:hypothetical protein
MVVAEVAKARPWSIPPARAVDPPIETTRVRSATPPNTPRWRRHALTLRRRLRCERSAMATLTAILFSGSDLVVPDCPCRGGLEYAFAGNWSTKVEGMFYNLGTITTSANGVPNTNFVRVKTFNVEGAVARVGVNWRFGGLGWY